MTIIKPTLKDLVRLNAGALRRLEHFAQQPDSNGMHLLYSHHGIAEAKPVDSPICMPVTYREGNVINYVGPVPERPYNWGRFNLNIKELKLVLGLIHITNYKNAYGTSMEDLNAMWKANQCCPSRDANAYLLGLFNYESDLPGFIVPVQYYHIDPQKQRELCLSRGELEENLKRQ